jgi:transaldolase
MAASFRNIDEILELAGCDLMTISPTFLSELQQADAPLQRKLDAAIAQGMELEKIAMDEAMFKQMHEVDRMAQEKLKEGIEGFSKAIIALERLLEGRLAEVEGQKRLCSVARDVFSVYDLDGDGAITREEWAGTDAVFDALDVDGDGMITPEELAAGLGAAHCLEHKSLQ